MQRRIDNSRFQDAWAKNTQLNQRGAMNIEQAVTEAFHESMELPTDVDMATLSYRGHPSWTSLGHMALVAALEDKFDVMLEADDILEMSSYQRVIDIMGKYDSDN
jgi:acyl carrier protein